MMSYQHLKLWEGKRRWTKSTSKYAGNALRAIDRGQSRWTRLSVAASKNSRRTRNPTKDQTYSLMWTVGFGSCEVSKPLVAAFNCAVIFWGTRARNQGRRPSCERLPDLAGWRLSTISARADPGNDTAPSSAPLNRQKRHPTDRRAHDSALGKTVRKHHALLTRTSGATDKRRARFPSPDTHS
jgi:hypothetical protein